jgi:hypothetical protein
LRIIDNAVIGQIAFYFGGNLGGNTGLLPSPTNSSRVAAVLSFRALASFSSSIFSLPVPPSCVMPIRHGFKRGFAAACWQMARECRFEWYGERYHPVTRRYLRWPLHRFYFFIFGQRAKGIHQRVIGSTQALIAVVAFSSLLLQ